MEGGGWEAELGGGGVAEFVEVEEAEGAGGVEVGDDVGGGHVGAGGPDGEDGGEVGHAAPLFDDVVDVEVFGAGKAESCGGGDFGGGGWRRGRGGKTGRSKPRPYRIGRVDGEADTEGGVADQKGGVAFGEHCRQIGWHFAELGGDLPVAGAEDFGEGLGAAGAAIEGDRSYRFFGCARWGDRDFGNEEEAADAAFGGDGEVGEDDEVVDALVFDGGDDGDVDFAGAEGFGALGGDGEAEIVFAGERAVGESPDERRGVEVLDDGDAEFWQGRSVFLTACSRRKSVATRFKL